MYTVVEVANICKVSTETVRRWIRDCKLHAFGKGVKGSRYLISEQDLDDFLKNRKGKYYIVDSSKKYLKIRNELLLLCEKINDLIEALES